jgi:hypothetical protein
MAPAKIPPPQTTAPGDFGIQRQNTEAVEQAVQGSALLAFAYSDLQFSHRDHRNCGLTRQAQDKIPRIRLSSKKSINTSLSTSMLKPPRRETFLASQFVQIRRGRMVSPQTQCRHALQALLLSNGQVNPGSLHGLMYVHILTM